MLRFNGSWTNRKPINFDAYQDGQVFSHLRRSTKISNVQKTGRHLRKVWEPPVVQPPQNIISIDFECDNIHDYCLETFAGLVMRGVYPLYLYGYVITREQ